MCKILYIIMHNINLMYASINFDNRGNIIINDIL